MKNKNCKIIATYHGPRRRSDLAGSLEILEKHINNEKKIDSGCSNDTIIINHKGAFVMCCNDYHNIVKLGNIKDNKLIDIWNSSHYKKIRNISRKRLLMFPICKSCGWHTK